MTNVLPRDRQLSVLSALVEGCSIRSVERMTGVHRDTIMRLGLRVGEGCEVLLDETMRDLTCERIEIDEIWSFVGKKQRRVRASDDPSITGDAWVFCAIDADTKLVPSHVVGKRDAETTQFFISDLKSRLRNRVQISSDGFRPYEAAIVEAFGRDGVDFARIVKEYEAEPREGRYSPPRVVATTKTPVIGEPIEEDVSTSFVERQNLTMRMQMRRYTRLTNAHSKKFRNHVAATALHFAHYNFVRLHQTLRVTPAMAAGVSTKLWSMGDLLDAANECSRDEDD